MEKEILTKRHTRNKTKRFLVFLLLFVACSSSVFAQSKTISGVVTSAGEPLIGAKKKEKGTQTFLKKLHSRPVKNEEKSTEYEYVFDCSELQAYNYFFSFGADAEILSPPSLRQKFADSYAAASKLYQAK